SCGSNFRSLPRRNHFQSANAPERATTPATTAAQRGGVGRCLGCRMSRMSSSATAGAGEATGVAGGKVFGEGLAVPDAAGGWARFAPGGGACKAEALRALNSRPRASARIAEPLERVNEFESPAITTLKRDVNERV